MKTREIEIQRANVTPAQFIWYVNKRIKKAGMDDIAAPDLDYFRKGDDLNFDTEHDGIHEISVSKPYTMQTYIRNADGTRYNEICEFEFDDEKVGHGYYYLRNDEND